MAKIPFFKRFGTKILIFAISITLFSILLTGSTITIGSKNTFEKNIATRNLEIARHASGEVSIFFKDSIDDLGELAEVVSSFDENRYIQQVILENVSFKMKRFNALNIIDKEGNILVSSAMETPDRVRIEKNLLREALLEDVSFSRVKLSKNNLPYLNLLIPIKKEPGKEEILITQLNLRSIWELIDSIKIGANGYSFLISKDGTLIAYPDKTKIFKKFEDNFLIKEAERQSQRGGIIKSTSPKGIETLSAVVPVGGTNWYLVVQQPLSDAYLSFRHLFFHSLGIMIVSLLIAIALSFLLSHKIMKPVEKLLEGTEKIARGELDTRIEIDSENEIGVLSSEFNKMAEKLSESMRALSESEQKYRLLIENVSDIILSLDLNGNFLFVTSNVEKILGYKTETLIGKSILNYTSGKTQSTLFDLFHNEDAYKETEMAKEIECNFTTKEGETKVLDLRLVKAKGYGDTKSIYYGTARDVTEKKELQNRLLQSEKLSLMGEIISEVTHELNNPLSGIMGFAELLLLDKSLNPESVKDVKKILEETERASKIIKNFLTFSRRYEPQKKSCNINQILESVLEIRAYDMNVSNIKVVRNFDSNIPLTMADSNQLRQVFLNLVSNAIYSMKETSKGGTLTIKTKRKDKKIIISISDTGKGIAKENVEKIFKAFFTTKEVGKGTGLGLSISKSIIEEHGGTIRVESTLGKGATFIIELPLEESVKENNIQEEKQEGKPLKGLRILVVDDEETILDFISMIFTKEGSVIDKALDGKKATEYLEKYDYDIIISDFKMPAMNGFELYDWIKRHKPHLAKRVAFVTGDILNQDIQMFFQRTGVFHINKPFGFYELKKLVSEIIENRN